MTDAPQEFNIEKLQMIEAEKQKIKKDYERKESQVEVQKKMCAQHTSSAPKSQPREISHSDSKS